MYTLYPNKMVSALTGKTYPFETDADGSSRRRALAQLERDDQKVIDAANLRSQKLIGRKLTHREIREGDWLPDARPLRQRVAEDGQVTQQSGPSGNPFAGHLESLRATQVHDRSPKLAERIALYEGKSAEWESAQAADAERESRLNHPDVKYWLADAGAVIALLQVDPDAPQEWLDCATDLRDRLKATGDVEAYKAGFAVLEDERKRVRQARAAELESQAKELRAEAKSVRNEACNIASAGSSPA